MSVPDVTVRSVVDALFGNVIEVSVSILLNAEVPTMLLPETIDEPVPKYRVPEL